MWLLLLYKLFCVWFYQKLIFLLFTLYENAFNHDGALCSIYFVSSGYIIRQSFISQYQNSIETWYDNKQKCLFRVPLIDNDFSITLSANWQRSFAEHAKHDRPMMKRCEAWEVIHLVSFLRRAEGEGEDSVFGEPQNSFGAYVCISGGGTGRVWGG